MSTDRVVRLDPKTGRAVQYLMPSDTNMRTVFVDNSTSPVKPAIAPDRVKTGVSPIERVSRRQP
jgi:hypothetical protein